MGIRQFRRNRNIDYATSDRKQVAFLNTNISHPIKIAYSTTNININLKSFLYLSNGKESTLT